MAKTPKIIARQAIDISEAIISGMLLNTVSNTIATIRTATANELFATSYMTISIFPFLGFVAAIILVLFMTFF